jgi:hypothetical protein
MFAAAFLVSGLAGLAALLRSGAPLGVLRVVSAFLNSGLLGLGLSMAWAEYFHETPHVLVGVCVLIGLGGTPTLEFILELIRKGGFSIRLGGGSLDVSEKKDDHQQPPKPPGESK